MAYEAIFRALFLPLPCGSVEPWHSRAAQAKKPNILVIFGDDIGITNLSCYSDGLMDIIGKCLTGYDDQHGHTYKVHLDGYDQSEFLTGFEGKANRNNGVKSAREIFFYSDDDGQLVGLRKADYKYSFSEQRLEGTMGVWAEPFTTLRMQKIYHLFQDPFERADITSNTYWDWVINHVGPIYGVMDDVFAFAGSLKEYPPRSTPPSFNPATILEQVKRGLHAKEAIEATFPMLKEGQGRHGER